MKATSQHGLYKFEGSISADRDDFGSEFGESLQEKLIGTIVVGLG